MLITAPISRYVLLPLKSASSSVIPDLVTYLENISVTQCISGFAKIWTPTA